MSNITKTLRPTHAYEVIRVEDEEFGRLINDVYDRIYLVKTCIERDIETVDEFQAVCRELRLEEHIHDPKVMRAIIAWHDLWHDFEIPDDLPDTDE